MNLPVYGSTFVKGCKVFALAGALMMCVACGSEPAEDAGETKEDTAVSTDVTVSDSEGKDSEEAPAAEAESSAAGEETSDTSNGSEETASSDASASTASEQQVAQKAPEQPRVIAQDGGAVVDPFTKRYSGAIRPKASRRTSAGPRTAAAKSSTGVAAPAASAKYAPNANVEEEEEEEVIAPDVKVTGIMGNNGSRTALFSSGDRVVMVKVGDVISGYKVTTITPSYVTVVYKGKHKFVLPMEREKFGTAKK